MIGDAMDSHLHICDDPYTAIAYTNIGNQLVEMIAVYSEKVAGGLFGGISLISTTLLQLLNQTIVKIVSLPDYNKPGYEHETPTEYYEIVQHMYDLRQQIKKSKSNSYTDDRLMPSHSCWNKYRCVILI